MLVRQGCHAAEVAVAAATAVAVATAAGVAAVEMAEAATAAVKSKRAAVGRRHPQTALEPYQQRPAAVQAATRPSAAGHPPRQRLQMPMRAAPISLSPWRKMMRRQMMQYCAHTNYYVPHTGIARAAHVAYA